MPLNKYTKVLVNYYDNIYHRDLDLSELAKRVLVCRQGIATENIEVSLRDEVVIAAIEALISDFKDGNWDMLDSVRIDRAVTAGHLHSIGLTLKHLSFNWPFSEAIKSAANEALLKVIDGDNETAKRILSFIIRKFEKRGNYLNLSDALIDKINEIEHPDEFFPSDFSIGSVKFITRFFSVSQLQELAKFLKRNLETYNSLQETEAGDRRCEIFHLGNHTASFTSYGKSFVVNYIHGAGNLVIRDDVTEVDEFIWNINYTLDEIASVKTEECIFSIGQFLDDPSGTDN